MPGECHHDGGKSHGWNKLSGRCFDVLGYCLASATEVGFREGVCRWGPDLGLTGFTMQQVRVLLTRYVLGCDVQELEESIREGEGVQRGGDISGNVGMNRYVLQTKGDCRGGEAWFARRKRGNTQ